MHLCPDFSISILSHLFTPTVCKDNLARFESSLKNVRRPKNKDHG